MLVGLASGWFGEPRVTLVASDRTELRVRDSDESTGTAVDVETAPALSVRVDDRRWRIDASYAPLFTEQAMLSDAAVREILQRAFVAASWHDRRVRLTAREEASYGDESFASLASLASLDAPAIAGVPRVETLLGVTTLRYASERSSLVARFALSRRWSLTSDVDYAESGGIDASSRTVIPFQRGPRLEETLEDQVARRDRIAAIIAVSHVTFSSGPEADLQETSGVWHHRFDPSIELGFRGGATLSATRTDESQPFATMLWPVAEVSIVDQRAGHYTFAASLRLGPVVDHLTGLIDERVQSSATLLAKVAPTWTIRGAFGSANSVRATPGNAVNLVLGEGAIGWRPFLDAGFEAGVRGAWQQQDGYGLQGPEWVVFVATTVITSPSSAAPLPAMERN